MSFDDAYLTKSEVAKMLRCSERTLERHVASGQFPPPHSLGKEKLWFSSIVCAFLESARQVQQQWLQRNGCIAVSETPRSREPANSAALSNAAASGNAYRVSAQGQSAQGVSPNLAAVAPAAAKSRHQPRVSARSSESFFYAQARAATTG